MNAEKLHNAAAHFFLLIKPALKKPRLLPTVYFLINQSLGEGIIHYLHLESIKMYQTKGNNSRIISVNDAHYIEEQHKHWLVV